VWAPRPDEGLDAGPVDLAAESGYHRLSHMGTLSLSVELELGWGQIREPAGSRFQNLSGPDRAVETARLRELLAVCDDHGVPISFDVVGHLLLEGCDGTHDGPHESGWFDIDPGTDVDADPLFYAPDLVTMIREAAVDHEICTHTFSHVPCDEVDESVVAWELDEARRVHTDAGLPAPASFVPPWHRMPSPALLTGRGIETVRVSDGSPTQDGGPLSSLRWKVEQFGRFLLRTPEDRAPVRRDGLCQVSTQAGPTLTSFALPHGSRPPHPAFRVLPVSLRKRAHRRYLDAALATVRREGTHVHLSTHLYDLGNDHQWSCVRPFLAAAGRDEDVRVEPLDSLCE